MSIESSIDLRIVHVKFGTILSPMDTLKILLDNGWNIVSNTGEAFYKMPNGDDEMLDWTIKKIELSALMEIFKKKEQNGELIGVMMNWQNTEIGGELLLRTEKYVTENNINTPMSFCLSSDRKILADYGDFKITDVNWYLERLLPIFNQGDTIVEYITYDEHI